MEEMGAGGEACGSGGLRDCVCGGRKDERTLEEKIIMHVMSEIPWWEIYICLQNIQDI